MSELAGVLPVVSTPFNEDETVDIHALEVEIDWLIALGVHGLTVAMVSEVLRMDVAERMHLTQRVCDAANGRVPVIASVGAESTTVAIKLAVDAQKCGVAAVMAVPPLTVVLADEQIYSYFAAILNGVDLPVIVQDASGYLGRPISLTLQADLLHKFGADRVFFKPEAQPIGPRLSEMLTLTGGQARVFEGTGGIALVESFQRGIVGTMPGADIPWAVLALWTALQQGDMARAAAIQGPLSSLISMQSTLDSFVAVEKHLLVHQRVLPSDRVRHPSGYELDATTRREVNRLFDVLTEIVPH